jgi:hypothetical protein
VLQKIAILICLTLITTARAAETSRFDELVIWKITDALKLDAETEQRFDQTLRSLNARKKTAAEALDAAGNALKKTTSTKDAEQKLARYRSALASSQKLQVIEIEEVQKLLGVKKAAEYLALKSEITDKIKEALLDTPTTGSAATRAATRASPSPIPVPLASPKLIEE